MEGITEMVGTMVGMEMVGMVAAEMWYIITDLEVAI
jgi:hypothetical protein